MNSQSQIKLKDGEEIKKTSNFLDWSLGLTAWSIGL